MLCVCGVVILLLCYVFWFLVCFGLALNLDSSLFNARIKIPQVGMRTIGASFHQLLYLSLK